MTILRPGMRFYLIHEIKDLADLDKQKKEWVNKDSKHCFWDNITTGTDCLWDGSLDFDKNPEEHIGETLRNDIELKAILNLIQKLEVVLEKIGKKKPDSAYFNSPLWNGVVEAAKQAYEVLMADEDLDALLEAEEKRVVT